MSDIGMSDIYRDSNVQITKTLVRIGQKSYPINGIGSVDIKKPDNESAFGMAILAFGAAVVAGYNGAEPGVIGLLIVVAVIALIVGYGKPSFLVLRTASGDQQALSSKKAEYLLKVKSAIETAVAMRG